jgi:HSP20 family protein
MRALTQRNPMASLMDEFFNTGYESDVAMSPRADITEDDSAYYVHVDLPGMDKKDVTITAERDVLRVSGERKNEYSDKKEGYRYTERSFGSFSREFLLPDNVDPEKIDATMKSGVLTLTIKKTEAKKPKEIDIKVN